MNTKITKIDKVPKEKAKKAKSKRSTPDGLESALVKNIRHEPIIYRIPGGEAANEPVRHCA